MHRFRIACPSVLKLSERTERTYLQDFGGFVKEDEVDELSVHCDVGRALVGGDPSGGGGHVPTEKPASGEKVE